MPSFRRSIIVSLLFTLFGGPGILLVLVPWHYTGFRLPHNLPPGQALLSAALIVAGLAPLLESIWRFIFVGKGTLVPTVPTEHLVVSGLYRFVRNPMYLGVMIVEAGEALLFRSSSLLVELSLTWLAVELFVRFYEEPNLTRRFPADYPEYRRHVRRWLPRLSPWRPSIG